MWAKAAPPVLADTSAGSATFRRCDRRRHPRGDEEVQTHLLRAFFTTQGAEQGTGLPMDRPVDRLWHHPAKWRPILVKTARARARHLKIFLPRADPPIASLAAEAENVPADSRRTRTISGWRSEENCGRSWPSYFAAWATPVLEADGGGQALRFVNRQNAPIHLVVTDIVMPGHIRD